MSTHVSAIICTRNRPDKIASAVESVLANDHPSFELTVTDQSSSSETEDVFAPIMAVDPRPRCYFLEQAVLSPAYNTAVSATTGDASAFTDDDYIEPVDSTTSVASVREGLKFRVDRTTRLYVER